MLPSTTESESGPRSDLLLDGGWDLLLALTGHFPVNNLGDLMRITSLAENFSNRRRRNRQQQDAA